MLFFIEEKKMLFTNLLKELLQSVNIVEIGMPNET